MTVQETKEIRELTALEVEQVTGGGVALVIAGGLALFSAGVAFGLIISSPDSIKSTPREEKETTGKV